MKDEEKAHYATHSVRHTNTLSFSYSKLTAAAAADVESLFGWYNWGVGRVIVVTAAVVV